INSDGNLAKAEDNGAWLCAKLIREVGTLKAFPACMKQHYDWSGKNCPAQIRGRKDGWKNFLAAVEKYLKPATPTTKLPTIDRTIGIEIGGKLADEPGYLIDNATYVRAAYLIGLTGGSVTGKGDYIAITLPKASGAELERLQKDLTAAQKDLAAKEKVIANVRKAIG
ncbi:MAG: hypothetical protein GX881_02230, partial [Firmicutes bacterium]|nr:hypothetical protein [Bacillota bacterium]